MRKILAFVVVLVAFLSSCDDQDELVPGLVAVGFDANVPVEDVFAMINEKGLHIDQISGFTNYSTLPNDQLGYVREVLKDKYYVNERGFTVTENSVYVHALDNRITVIQELFDMDKAAQQDWLDTREELELKDLQGNAKYIQVKVKPGLEKFWVGYFKRQPGVQWAEPNYYVDIKPHY